MDPTLRKTCDWIKKHQKILDRTSYIITHDPVSSQEILHSIFIHDKQTLVFENLLADSTFKKTYLAYDPETKEHLVVGVTKNAIPINHGELSVMNKLQELNLHGIVPIKKITYLPSGAKAILFGYCNGGDLEARIKKGPLTENEKLLLTRSIVKAVALLHRNKIVHRDLKAANILLSINRRNKVIDVFLSDFGESILLNAAHSLSHIEHGHSPPEANEIMEKHRGPLQEWYKLQEAEKMGPVDPEWKAKVEKNVDPFTRELNEVTKAVLYDSWGLGLTLFCLWNDSSYEDFAWTKDVDDKNYAGIAKKKRAFIKDLEKTSFQDAIKKLLQELLAGDIQKRLTAREAAKLLND